MTSTTKTPVTPEGLPVDSQRKLRRMVLGGSVGSSLLLALILAFTGPGETAPAAAPVSANPHADGTPGAETYPIPPQVGADDLIPHAVVDREATPSAPAQEPAGAFKTDSDSSKAGRNRVAAHKQAAVSRPDSRTTHGRGNAAASVAASRADSAPKPEAPSPGPTVDVKKRVPLVDEQTRVRILE